MDRDLTQFVPQNGMDVIGADGEKVGEIDGVERDYFIVRKGFFFPQDHYIPMTAISSYDSDSVYLNVTRDEALEQEWNTPPDGIDATTDDQETRVNDQSDAPRNDNGVIVGKTGRVSQTEEPEVAEYGHDDDTLAGISTDSTNNINADPDNTTVDVHKEELVADKHDVERGEVRVSKNVVEEEQSLDVPVTEEEVDVTRRRVDREATADDHAFEEGTIEVPLRGEEVDVEKRNRIIEEIEIDKTARTRDRTVTDTVRREEVDVEGDNVEIENETRDHLNDADRRG